MGNIRAVSLEFSNKKIRLYASINFQSHRGIRDTNSHFISFPLQSNLLSRVIHLPSGRRVRWTIQPLPAETVISFKNTHVTDHPSLRDQIARSNSDLASNIQCA